KDKAEIPGIKELYFRKGKSGKSKITFDPHKAYQKLSFTGLTPIYDPLISLLSSSPPFYHGKGDFREQYRNRIDKIAKNAQKVLKGKLNFSQLLNQEENEQHIHVRTQQKVVLDEQFIAKVLINDNSFSLREFMAEIAAI